MPDGHDKPTVIIHGNCIGQAIADQVRRVAAVTERFDVHWVRNFSAQYSGDEPFDDSAFGRCRYLLEQVSDFKGDPRRLDGDLKELPVPPDCRRVRYPPVFMNTLWPFLAPDPRSEALRCSWWIEGPYPSYLSDRLIIQIMRTETDPDRIYERYRNIRIRDLVDLDRIHQLYLHQIRRLEQASDIVVGDFIESNFTKKRLFRMQAHPAGPMIRKLCEDVFQAIDIPSAETASFCEELEQWVGSGHYDAPIHPEMIEHFGLDWARDLTYQHFSEGWFSYDEFIRRYIRLDWTPVFYQGWHAFTEGRLDEAEAFMLQAIAENPSRAITDGLWHVRERRRLTAAA